MSKLREERKAPQQVGGIAFFASLVVLLFFAPINISYLRLLALNCPASIWLWCLGGLALGAVFARIFIWGHIAVLIHELKHSIISNLAGNKSKGMNVKRESGHFEYSYTKSTAAFNAFIHLAPYIMPLFSILALCLSYLFFPSQHNLAVLLTAFAFGADLLLGFRDVHPNQSDIYSIRGGFYIGMLYIAAMNLALTSIFLAWVGAGWIGLKGLALYWISFAQLLLLNR